MNISAIRLKQSLSARVASTGLQSSYSVGGNSIVSLSSADADIAYGFSLVCADTNNQVKWTLDTHTLEMSDPAAAGSYGGGYDIADAPYGTEAVGLTGAAVAILDGNTNTIPDANLALAIYYEIPADTATDAWVQAVGTSADQANVFSTVKLVGHTGSSTGARSALLTPRAGCNFDYITFSFGPTSVGLKVNVVYLANTTS